MGRILCIDYGTKRHGLALSDGLRLTARPAGVIERPTTRAEEFDRIAAVVKREGVDLVVMGYPLNMDGTPGTHAPEVRRYAEALTEFLGLDIHLVDERLTTVQAEAHLRSTGRGREKRKAMVDAVAAALTLQTYLERLARL